MPKPRASIFPENDLDLSGFTPEAVSDVGPDPETMRIISAQSNFPSRDPKPAVATKRPPRRHRTGRTAQFNARTTPQTVEAFYVIADRKGWLVGETVERALAALLREIEKEVV